MEEEDTFVETASEGAGDNGMTSFGNPFSGNGLNMMPNLQKPVHTRVNPSSSDEEEEEEEEADEPEPEEEEEAEQPLDDMSSDTRTITIDTGGKRKKRGRK